MSLTTKTESHGNLNHDDASTLAIKLASLLEATYGHSGESFREMADELQDGFMWACADLAHQLRDELVRNPNLKMT